MNESSRDMFLLPPRQLSLVIFESTCAVLFTVLAVIGNSVVFAVFMRERGLRTEPNILLLNLSVADILSGSITLPLLSSTLVSGRWTFGPHVCQLQAFQSYSSYACNLCTMAVISVCRYFATMHPLTYSRGMFRGKFLMFIISGMWFVSIMLAVTPLFGWGVFRFESSYALCMHEHSASISYNIFHFLFLVLNASVIIVSYVKISKVMRARRRRLRTILFLSALGGRRGRIIDLQAEKVTNTVLVIILCFGICYIPTVILGFLVFTTLEIPRSARMLSTFSVGLSCVTNPVVYWTRNKILRKALRRVLMCGRNSQVDIAAHFSRGAIALRAKTLRP